MDSLDKIICVGKNYLDHALELGDAVPDEPIFFFKPPSCLRQSPTEPIPLPTGRGSVHHELEIVYRIRRSGPVLNFDAVTLGLDLTLRDVQNSLKKKGSPWEASKAFPQAAVIGPWLDAHRFPDHLRVPFQLRVNGEVRQKATGDEMRDSPEKLLKVASKLFDVRDGDLFFSGTPKGVGAILSGDRLELSWGDHLEFAVDFS